MGSVESVLDESLDYAHVPDWSVSQVCYWIKSTQTAPAVTSQEENNSMSSSSPLTIRLVTKYDIDGRKLLALNEHSLNRIGVKKLSDQRLVLSKIDELKRFMVEYSQNRLDDQSTPRMSNATTTMTANY